MKLETTIKPLPKDSTILIRPKSALGLKYVEITKGTSDEGYPDGATIPITAATPKQVEFDEVLSTFDEKTRGGAARQPAGVRRRASPAAARTSTSALQDLNPLLAEHRAGHAEPRRSADAPGSSSSVRSGAPRRRSRRWPSSRRRLFVNLDTTFAALAKVARPYLQDSITSGVPATERRSPTSRSSARSCATPPACSPTCAPGHPGAAHRGADPAPTRSRSAPARSRRSVALNARLKPTFKALQDFATDPLVALGVRGPHEHGVDPRSDDQRTSSRRRRSATT